MRNLKPHKWSVRGRLDNRRSFFFRSGPDCYRSPGSVVLCGVGFHAVLNTRACSLDVDRFKDPLSFSRPLSASLQLARTPWLDGLAEVTSSFKLSLLTVI